MKLLLDLSVSRRMIPDLVAAGYDVEHAGDVGLASHADREVFAHAFRHDRITISQDGYFGELGVPRQGRTLTILLRTSSIDPRFQSQVLLTRLPETEPPSLPGLIATLMDDGGEVCWSRVIDPC